MIISKRYEIGQRVRELRNQRGYTKELLAEKAGISIGFLGDIEKGKKGASADTLVGLSLALRVSVDFILFGREIETGSLAVEQSIGSLNEEEQTYVKRLFLEALQILDDIPRK